MPKGYFKLPSNTGSGQLCRFSLRDSTGSATGYIASQVFTTTANSSYKKKSLLPVCNISEPGFSSGTEMVVQQPGDLQWQTNYVSNVINSNTFRCFQKALEAYCQKVLTGGQWTLQESHLHISVLES